MEDLYDEMHASFMMDAALDEDDEIIEEEEEKSIDNRDTAHQHARPPRI